MDKLIETKIIITIKIIIKYEHTYDRANDLLGFYLKYAFFFYYFFYFSFFSSLN